MKLTNEELKNLKVINNFVLVQYKRDLDENSFIKIVKMNNSSMLRTVFLGTVIKHPTFYYMNDNHTSKVYLTALEDNKTEIAYDPKSIQIEIYDDDDNRYHIIRAEDIFYFVE